MDTIYYNGIIHSGIGQTFTAMGVLRGRIQAMGDDERVQRQRTKNTRMVNLDGKVIFPGFIDSHCHLLGTGLALGRLQLGGATSVEEIIARGKAYLIEHNVPVGEWLVGIGYNQDLFSSPHFPTKEVADAISTQHPVLLCRVCNHIGTLNTMALEQLGLLNPLESSQEGVDLSSDGIPNGVVREAALSRVRASLPFPAMDRMVDMLATTMARMNERGLTSIHSNDGTASQLPFLIEAFDRLKEEDLCTLRVYEEVSVPNMEEMDVFFEGGFKNAGDDYFKIGNLKLLVDGSLGGRTAYLRESYADDPQNRGVSIYKGASLDMLIRRAQQEEVQIAVHAIGDGALLQCINAFRRISDIPRKDHLSYDIPSRHRIVHCQVGDAPLYQQMAELSLCADVQPPFMPTDSRITRTLLGKEREACSYAWKTLLDYGIPLGGGSDSPIESFDPLYGIYCAITRTDREGNPAGGWLPNERLTPEEALSLYTRGPAYLAFEENEKGTLESGKMADFVVLDRDILSIPPEEILTTQVILTVVGGKEVYRRQLNDTAAVEVTS